IASLLVLPVHAQEPQQAPPPAPQPAVEVEAPEASDSEAGSETGLAAESGPEAGPDAEAPSSAVPLAEISRYVLVFNAVRSGYVDPVDDADLMQSAIRGLLLDLDPHSAYLERSDAEAFDENTSGAYEGIGVEVMPLPDG